MRHLFWGYWYNTQRLLEAIGYLSPAEHELNYYRRQKNPPAAAGLNESSLR